jgi:RNA polymerase sigma factor (sigma-70 family)
MRDNPAVTALVTRARSGDQQAWDLLVEHYAPLVWSICRRYGLDDADAGSASQDVWLRLLEQLDQISDPAVLPGWLAAATRRESSRFLRPERGSRANGSEAGADGVPGEQAQAAERELYVAELHGALLDALTQLPPCCQQLIALLTAYPPVSQAEIGVRLNMPPGTIGPHRSRCLDELRRHPAVAALIGPDGGP